MTWLKPRAAALRAAGGDRLDKFKASPELFRDVLRLAHCCCALDEHELRGVDTCREETTRIAKPTRQQCGWCCASVRAS
jgi:hypothetical protein